MAMSSRTTRIFGPAKLCSRRSASWLTMNEEMTTNRPERMRGSPEADDWRMMTIAEGPTCQHRLGEERLAPERHNAGGGKLTWVP